MCRWASILYIFCQSVCRCFATYWCCHPCSLITCYNIWYLRIFTCSVFKIVFKLNVRVLTLYLSKLKYLSDLMSFAFIDIFISVFRRIWLKSWAVIRPRTNSTQHSMTKLKYLKPVTTRINRTKNRFSNQDSSRKRRLRILLI